MIYMSTSFTTKQLFFPGPTGEAVAKDVAQSANVNGETLLHLKLGFVWEKSFVRTVDLFLERHSWWKRCWTVDNCCTSFSWTNEVSVQKTIAQLTQKRIQKLDGQLTNDQRSCLFTVPQWLRHKQLVWTHHFTFRGMRTYSCWRRLEISFGDVWFPIGSGTHHLCEVFLLWLFHTFPRSQLWQIQVLSFSPFLKLKLGKIAHRWRMMWHQPPKTFVVEWASHGDEWWMMGLYVFCPWWFT